MHILQFALSQGPYQLSGKPLHEAFNRNVQHLATAQVTQETSDKCVNPPPISLFADTG